MTVLCDADAHPLRLIAQIQDITDRRRSEERLVYLADHDPLTGLLNRRSFDREFKPTQAHRALRRALGQAGAAPRGVLRPAPGPARALEPITVGADRLGRQVLGSCVRAQ